MKIEIELVPIRVPNYVMHKARAGKRQDGFLETPKTHVSELSVDALNGLCEQFKKDLFANAAKAAE